MAVIHQFLKTHQLFIIKTAEIHCYYL